MTNYDYVKRWRKANPEKFMEEKQTKWEQVKAAKGIVSHRIDKHGAWMHITHPSTFKCEYCEEDNKRATGAGTAGGSVPNGG